MNVKVLRQFSHRVLAPMAANATFALNAGVWFRRARLLIVSPESAATACPLSGRNSTYRSVQISGTSSPCYRFRDDGDQSRGAILEAIIEATNRHIRALRSFGLDDTAKIFAIAKLDLQTKLHGISDEELQAFCQAVDLKRGRGVAEVIDFAARKSNKA